ncbi:hypothetical protein Lser_V15G23372 [Lactuca serriola]
MTLLVVGHIIRLIAIAMRGFIYSYLERGQSYVQLSGTMMECSM